MVTNKVVICCCFLRVQGLYWMLDGTPASTCMPLLLSASCLHLVAAFQGSTVWLALQLTAVLLAYLVLGEQGCILAIFPCGFKLFMMPTSIGIAGR